MQAEKIDFFDEARLPRRPYCSDDPKLGSQIKRLNIALQHKYIQVNPPGVALWMVFDVDRHPAARRWSEVNLPAPAFSTCDYGTLRGHLVYGLTYPVRTTEINKQTRLPAAVQEAFRLRLDADEGYSGLLTKNPRSRERDGSRSWFCAPWAVGKTYTLTELLDWVDLPKVKRQQNENKDIRVGLGRNIEIFDRLRFWAYRSHAAFKDEEIWILAVRRQAEVFRLTSNHFPVLSEREVGGISRSVARWVWRRRHLLSSTFSKLQSERGKRGGRPQVEKPWLPFGLSRSGYMAKVSAGTLRPLPLTLSIDTQTALTSHD